MHRHYCHLCRDSVATTPTQINGRKSVVIYEDTNHTVFLSLTWNTQQKHSNTPSRTLEVPEPQWSVVQYMRIVIPA